MDSERQGYDEIIVLLKEIRDAVRATADIAAEGIDHGVGVIESLSDEGSRLLVHHVKNGATFLTTYVNKVGTGIPGVGVNFTFSHLEMFEKPDTENGGVTYKLQIEGKTNSGILPLEAGAESAFSCGIVRQIAYLIEQGYPIDRRPIQITFRPGSKSAVFADISTDRGPVILPKNSGGPWKIQDADINQQPWYRETCALLNVLKSMGMSPMADKDQPAPTGEWLKTTSMNAPSLDEVRKILRWIQDSPMAEEIPDADRAAVTQLLTHKEKLMEEFGETPVQLLAASDVELKRLGWDAEAGRHSLSERYGLRSRQELNDSQLFDFVAFLRTQ